MTKHDNTEIITDVVGEERLKEVCSMGITEEELLNIWHDTDEKPTEFREAVDRVLDNENTQNAVEYADMTIDNLMTQIETLQDMKAGLLNDRIKEELENGEV